MRLDRRTLLIILVAASAAGVGIALALVRGNADAWALRQRDALDYHLLAVNLLEHGVFSKAESPPYEPSGWREPGYPLFVAGCYAAFGVRPFGVVMVQAVLGALGVALFCELVARLSGRAGAARMALAGCAYLAVEFFYAQGWTLLFREDLQLMLTVASVRLGLRAAEEPRSMAWVWCGALVGAATLIKATSIIVVVAYAVVWLRRAEWARSIGGVLVTTAVAMLVVAPWLIRNQRVFGQSTMAFVSGVNLWQHSGRWDRRDGVEAEARRVANHLGSRWPNVGKYAPEHGAALATEPGWRSYCHKVRWAIADDQHVTEEAADQIMTHMVWQDIREDPLRYAWKTGVYLASYLSGGAVEHRPMPEDWWTKHGRMSWLLWKVLYPIGQIALLVLAAWGWRRSADRFAAMMVLWLAVIMLVCHAALAQPTVRYMATTNLLMAGLALGIGRRDAGEASTPAVPARNIE